MERTKDFKKRCVYVYGLCTNRNNTIRYVGITVDLNQRLLDHLKPSHFKENTYKARWINKVSKNNEIIEIKLLKTCKSWEEGCYYEKYYIKTMDNLTNLTSGGEGSLGRKVSDKTRYLMGSGNRGMKASVEKRKHISEGLKKAYATGKRRMSKSQLEKMSVAAKKRHSLPIIQLSKPEHSYIKEWGSITEAAKFLGCSITTLVDCLKRRTKSSQGYYWKYKKDYEDKKC
jgi:group I intron endonuclease